MRRREHLSHLLASPFSLVEAVLQAGLCALMGDDRPKLGSRGEKSLRRSTTWSGTVLGPVGSPAMALPLTEVAGCDP